jgi:hypothetical protein
LALTPEQLAEINAIIDIDWSSIPTDVQPDLEAAATSGAANAIAGGHVTSGSAINSANQAARDYATERSAEMVGMKYDEEGNLIPNPDAEWAISETTRETLRQLLTESFEQETSTEDLLQNIADSGLFSAARARMIARTEVNQAEVGGNIASWKAMGGGGSYDWVTGPNPCEECQKYAEEGPYTLQEIEDLMDDTHPNCSCGPVPNIEEDEES